MLRSVLLSLSFVTLTVLGAAAQSGTVKGTVKDGISGDPIIGANVIIAGTGLGAVADAEGNFEIPKVKVGSYNLILSFISYKSDTLKNITVYPDQVTLINTTLVEESAQLNEVVISGERVRNTDVAIISDIKAAQLVVSGISAQQISMSQDRDAAQIVKRIPGITIVGNRFVNVRGLSERYTSVLLNGVIAPSTEVDSRAFAFDLIPSSMIDRMLVYKSGGANLPGDFAGAVIDVGTKNVVDENELSVNVTAGVRMGTTFGDFYTAKGSSTDWLGYDNGYRDLSNDFPTTANLVNAGTNLNLYRNRQLVGNAGLGMNNNWTATQGTAAPDLRTTINFSRSGYIGEKRFGNITSISYSNTRQRLEVESNQYEAYDPDKGVSPGRRLNYFDYRDAVSVRLGVISNFIFEFNPSNKIEFRNFYNQQGVSEATVRTGVEDVQNFEIANTGINYTQRGVYTGQLVGRHSLNDKLNLNWTFGYGNMTADQPDYRRLRSQRTIGTTDPFSVVIPPSANSVDGRLYSELTEKVYTHALDVEYKLNPSADEKKQAKITAGYYLSQTERDFAARWFSFNWVNGKRDPAVERLPFNEIFIPGRLVNAEDAQGRNDIRPDFILNEGTGPTDSYTAENLYTAGYVNFMIPVNAFKFSVGTRVEYNRQQLEAGPGADVEKVDNPVTSFLPFANLSYDVTEKSLVRLAYSKTINRPVFREIAPFNYYDFNRTANFFGNPDLNIADIHNVDLRFEHYPTPNEMVSFGVFYKYFKNQIEQQLVAGSNLIYTFANGESATSYGAEVELRKSLEGLTGSGFVNKLNAVFNATWIESKVKLTGEFDNQELERPMQGQSPYVINAGLNYVDQEHTFQVNLAYNVFGKRIFAVGDLNPQTGVAGQFATQYEMPRNQIDLTISKGLGQRFEVKAGIQDILNQDYHLIQDTDNDKKIKDIDDDIMRYKPGQYVTLGVTYRIK
jgi:outer membrane receptor for ferrienterochelin and colicin